METDKPAPKSDMLDNGEKPSGLHHVLCSAAPGTPVDGPGCACRLIAKAEANAPAPVEGRRLAPLNSARDPFDDPIGVDSDALPSVPSPEGREEFENDGRRDSAEWEQNKAASFPIIDHPYGAAIQRDHLRMGLEPIIAFANGNRAAGWQDAHDPAGCGHPRACWIDAKWNTPDYHGDEQCIMCAAESQLASVRAERDKLEQELDNEITGAANWQASAEKAEIAAVELRVELSQIKAELSALRAERDKLAKEARKVVAELLRERLGDDLRMLALLVAADSYLSLLRHRGGIKNWGSMGMCEMRDVDATIGALRSGQKKLDAEIESLRRELAPPTDGKEMRP